MKLRETALEFYLDYVNNYLTVERIAEHHTISTELALALINEGRALHKAAIQLRERDIGFVLADLREQKLTSATANWGFTQDEFNKAAKVRKLKDPSSAFTGLVRDGFISQHGQSSLWIWARKGELLPQLHADAPKVLTQGELQAWKESFPQVLEDQLPCVIHGVHLAINTSGALSFCYKNASGLVFADNGYLGENQYYPLLRLSPAYTSDSKYALTCKPELAEVAQAVINSWAKFTA